MQIGTVVDVTRDKVTISIGNVRIEFEQTGYKVKEGDSVIIKL